jgi:hypothetical protein
MRRRLSSLGVLLAVVAMTSAVFARPLYGQTAGPAIGTYPPVLEFGEVARSGVSLQDLGLINGTAEEQSFTFDVAGKVAPWVSFVLPSEPDVPVDSIKVPARSDGHAGVRVAVPPTVPNGSYTGTITVFGQVQDPQRPTASPVQVASRSGISVTVDAQQSISGAFTELTVTPLLEVGSPLRVMTTIRNSGNVSIEPDIGLTVLAGSRTIDRARKADIAVQPRTSSAVELDWNTKGLSPGSYTAVVGVTFANQQLGTKKATFRVVPLGSMGRSGTLSNLIVIGGVQRAGLTRVQGTFTNSGKAESRVRLRVQVHRDKGLVDEVTGDEVATLPGQTVALSALVPTSETGSYEVVGAGLFDNGSTTASQRLAFSVGSHFPLVLMLAGLAALALVVLGAFLLLRTRRQRRGGKRRGSTPRLQGRATSFEPTRTRLTGGTPAAPSSAPRDRKHVAPTSRGTRH